MYQLEVKAQLVTSRFHATQGWRVTVHVDPMERAQGGTHPEDKRAIAERCLAIINEADASIGAHPVYGRVDIVAERDGEPCYFIEVEGQSSRQREQAVYSALGQLVVAMNVPREARRYGLAVPDDPEWVAQVSKFPQRILDLLNIEVFLVSKDGVRMGNADTNWAG